MSVAGNKNYYTLAIVDDDGNQASQGIPIPRLTTILDVMPKNPGAMRWSGYKIGIEAVQDFAQHEQDVSILTMSLEDAYERLKTAKRITPNTNLKKAQGRGTDVHGLAELFFGNEEFYKKGVLPPELIPPGKEGYARALLKWWELKPGVRYANPAPKVLGVEVALISLDPLFCGTTDLILKTPAEFEVIDFKTSKGIYDSALIQVAGYEHAARQMGLITPPHPERSRKLVVRLGADGEFEEKRSDKTIDDLRAVYGLWESLNRAG